MTPSMSSKTARPSGVRNGLALLCARPGFTARPFWTTDWNAVASATSVCQLVPSITTSPRASFRRASSSEEESGAQRSVGVRFIRDQSSAKGRGHGD